MKNKANLILLLLFLYSCFSHGQSMINDLLQQQNPFELRDTIGIDEIIETKIFYDNNGESDTLIVKTIFDAQFQIIRHEITDDTGPDIYDFERENGKISTITIKNFDENHSLKRKTVKKHYYNVDGRLEKVEKETNIALGEIKNYGRNYYEKFIKWDTLGFPIEAIEKSTHSILRQEKAKYNFEENTVLIEYYSSNNSYIYSKEYTISNEPDKIMPNDLRYYNSNGHLTFEKIGNGKFNHYVYKYDLHGNWVERTVFVINLGVSSSKIQNYFTEKIFREIIYPK